jgi:hypothetical protein
MTSAHRDFVLLNTMAEAIDSAYLYHCLNMGRHFSYRRLLLLSWALAHGMIPLT